MGKCLLNFNILSFCLFLHPDFGLKFETKWK